jgi:hypothetical protein
MPGVTWSPSALDPNWKVTFNPDAAPAGYKAIAYIFVYTSYSTERLFNCRYNDRRVWIPVEFTSEAPSPTRRMKRQTLNFAVSPEVPANVYLNDYFNDVDTDKHTFLFASDQGGEDAQKSKTGYTLGTVTRNGLKVWGLTFVNPRPQVFDLYLVLDGAGVEKMGGTPDRTLHLNIIVCAAPERTKSAYSEILKT